MKYIGAIFFLIIPLQLSAAVTTTDWSSVYNRSTGSRDVPQGFDINNVVIMPGDARALGLDNESKSFLQSRSLKPESHVQGLNTDFAGRLSRFFRAAESAGYGLKIYSGYRSNEHQARLFRAAVSKYGSERAARRYVAPPGRSNHNRGIAADLRYSSANAKRWAHANAQRYGLKFRMAHEPWHIEPSGNVRQGSENYQPNPRQGDSTSQAQQWSLSDYIKKWIQRPQEGQSQGGQQVNSMVTPSTQNNPQSSPSSVYNPPIRTQQQGLLTKPTNPRQKLTPATTSKTKTKPKQWGAARISCKPSGLNKVRILWRCDSPSTNSRGGTTDRRGGFSTKGKLKGGGYSTFAGSIGYRVQCLSNGKVVGEATCRAGGGKDTKIRW